MTHLSHVPGLRVTPHGFHHGHLKTVPHRLPCNVIREGTGSGFHGKVPHCLPCHVGKGVLFHCASLGGWGGFKGLGAITSTLTVPRVSFPLPAPPLLIPVVPSTTTT